MAQVRGIRIDENEADKRNEKITLRKVLPTKNTKRAALGELGNLNLQKNEENAKNKSITTKPVINLKNIKPRVDTHWKRAVKPSKTEKVGTKTEKVVAVVRPYGIDKTEEVKVKAESKPIPVARREEVSGPKLQLSKIRAALKDQRKPKVEAKIRKSVSSETEETTSITPVSLASSVENIDLNDGENLLLVSEYVNDIFDYLYKLEKDFPIKENHLQDQVDVTPKMRAVLVDWLNEVHFQFHLATETYHMTIGILDRYLQDVKTVVRKNLQLVGVTALYIASKFEEMFPPDLADFIFITDDTYTRDQLLQMEKNIVWTLDFQFCRPLSIHFLRRFSKAAKFDALEHLIAKYFIELVTMDYTMCHYKPSEVAAASVLLTLILCADDGKQPIPKLWTPTLQYYSRYSIGHLSAIVKKISILVRDAPTFKLSAVYAKYQSPKFEKVSMRPELKRLKRVEDWTV